MCEHDRRTLLQIGCDVLLVDVRLGLVGKEHHHDIRILHRIRDGGDLHSVLLRLVE